MKKPIENKIKAARKAALDVLLHNANGPYMSLPRTAAWGYPEPYTRDLMIWALGVMASKNEKLLKKLHRVLVTLAQNQSPLGHIPSLVHDPQDRGASDTTPLFIMTLAIYRKFINEPDFLKPNLDRALMWMQHQSPDNRVLVAQLPTTDWRDEQWILGYGLFVNTLVYTYLMLLNKIETAQQLRKLMSHFAIKADFKNRHTHEGLLVKYQPYYAAWAFKIYSCERFDLLGNSIAIISGLAPRTRAKSMIEWIEKQCQTMMKNGDLAVNMPPNFFPYIQTSDPDWLPRYEKFNKPGEYHNGGIWPYICGFYIAALVAGEKYKLAEQKLEILTELITPAVDSKLDFGFNEWIKAQSAAPQGQDWQTWSASMYLYAAACVENKSTLFFDDIRKLSASNDSTSQDQ